MLEVDDIARYGTQAVTSLVDSSTHAAAKEWLALLDDCLLAAGSLDGADKPQEKTIVRQHSVTPYVYDGVPRRLRSLEHRARRRSSGLQRNLRKHARRLKENGSWKLVKCKSRVTI